MKHLLLLMGRALALTAVAWGVPLAAHAADAPALDTGSTAWMIAATALLMIMYLPGLAMFYGGLLRAKNVLSVFTQMLLSAAVVGILFVLYGYSLMLDMTGAQAGEITLRSFIGGFDKWGLLGINLGAGLVPEGVMVTFLMMFGIISPAIVTGGFAERIRFPSAVLFLALWFTFAYLPMAHMVWAGPGALLADWGALDFAGGTAVHINTGVAALVAAMVLGPRKHYQKMPMPPHNLTMTLIGGGLLWAGWVGFNVGSGMLVDAKVGTTLLTTQLGACAGIVGWTLIETLRLGRPSALGAISGAIAGLVGVTPACAFVGALGAIAIGLAAGAVCFLGCTSLKHRFGYDDTLDVFGLHGVGGMVGALLTGVFASPSLGGNVAGLVIGRQVLIQLASVAFTVVFSAVVTWLILKLLQWTVGLRVPAEEEEQGLDISHHNENAYN